MQILRKMTKFGASLKEKKQIYFSFVRSHLEKSATLWHSSLTEKKQKWFREGSKNSSKNNFGQQHNNINYKEDLLKFDIDDLSTRREKLCLDFAKKCTKHPKLSYMFPTTNKTKGRKSNKYVVQFANTERLKQSAIIYMQNLLNVNN